MGSIVPLRPKKRGYLRKVFFVLSAVVCAGALAWGYSYWGPPSLLKSTIEAARNTAATSVPSVGRQYMTRPTQNVQVVDGDTVRMNGKTYRVVGFDTPESGDLAKCEAERKLAARATAKMQEIVATGHVEVARVACACPVGTEGTNQCNYGRLCGVLLWYGRDVASIMIGAGLARRYDCSTTRCPPRQSWC